MAGAVYLAQRLGRTLIVDWRGQEQLRDKSLNYFTEFFETPPDILGVPVVYAPHAPDDYAPESSAAQWVEPIEAYRLGTGAAETEAEFVVCQTFHGPERLHPGPEPERFRFLRSFYRAIRPSAELQELADRWWVENCDGAFVVGVNVRTGNGHYYGKGMRYAGRVDVSLFDDRARFLRKLESACNSRARHLPKPLRGDYTVFHATDSAPMSRLLSELPRARTRRSTYPPEGTGDLHSFSDQPELERESIVDTIIDMFLLARCDAFVYNSSVFNQYARVRTGYFGGNLVHIESLYLRKRTAAHIAAMRRALR